MKYLVLLLLAMSASLFFGFGVIRGVTGEPSSNLAEPHDAKKYPRITKEDLEEARATWGKMEISNYRMVVRLKNTGFSRPAERTLIEVKNGETVSIKSLEDSRPIANYQKFSTIEKIFDVIADQLKFDTEIRGKFNKTHGYPERLYVLNPDGAFAAYELYIESLEPIELS